MTITYKLEISLHDGKPEFNFVMPGWQFAHSYFDHKTLRRAEDDQTVGHAFLAQDLPWGGTEEDPLGETFTIYQISLQPKLELARFAFDNREVLNNLRFAHGAFACLYGCPALPDLPLKKCLKHATISTYTPIQPEGEPKS